MAKGMLITRNKVSTTPFRHEDNGREEAELQAFLTLAVDRDEWSASRPPPLYPQYPSENT